MSKCMYIEISLPQAQLHCLRSVYITHTQNEGENTVATISGRKRRALAQNEAISDGEYSQCYLTSTIRDGWQLNSMLCDLQGTLYEGNLYIKRILV